MTAQQDGSVFPDQSATLAALRDEVARHFDGVPAQQRDLATALPYLTLMRLGHATAMGQGVLEPSMCLVIQGSKKMLVGASSVAYGAGAYAVSAIEIPSAGQVTSATPETPYLAVRIALDASELAALIIDHQLPLPKAGAAGAGVYVAASAPELQDALLRLVRLLGRPQELRVLAALVKREILYRLLAAEGGAGLYQAVVAQSREQGVHRAIHWIKEHFAEPMRIDALARQTSMSASVLHRRFKAITVMSPLQYQKQMRLLEARRRLLGGHVEAATVAFGVGYQSASQFSREYRRFFGVSPSQDSVAGQAGTAAMV